MKIIQTVLTSIAEHAKRENPIEACGYLAEEDGVITKHYELTNVDGTRDHFTMDHKEQFAAVKDMREKGLKLAAVYHSHPETPARPSAEDIRLAFDPDISYVIVSLAEWGNTKIKSYKIRRGKATSEEIEPVDLTANENRQQMI